MLQHTSLSDAQNVQMSFAASGMFWNEETPYHDFYNLISKQPTEPGVLCIQDCILTDNLQNNLYSVQRQQKGGRGDSEQDVS